MPIRTRKPKEIREAISKRSREGWSLEKTTYVFDDLIPENYTIVNNLSPKEIEFLWFNLKNPDFYDLFLKFTREALHGGKDKLSAWLIVNRIRWEGVIKINVTDDDYAIPNGLIAYYSRYVMDQNPDIPNNFFDIRPLKPGV